MNLLRIALQLNFRNNKLEIQATGAYEGQTALPSGMPTSGEFRIFRAWPLSELEARSLHFSGSNPLIWIEDHMIDLVLLEGFNAGWDLRETVAHTQYIDSFVQMEGETDEGVDGVHPVDYRWSHDRMTDELILTESGADIIGRFPVRGPQNYLQLCEFQNEVHGYAVKTDGLVKAEV
jgi:hypothetical protein